MNSHPFTAAIAAEIVVVLAIFLFAAVIANGAQLIAHHQ